MNLPTSWRDWRDRYRQMRRDAAYLLLAWPLNVVAFIIVVTLIGGHRHHLDRHSHPGAGP